MGVAFEIIGVGRGFAGLDFEKSGSGDHSGVIGAVLGCREVDFGVFHVGEDGLAEFLVGGDAAGEENGGGTVVFHSFGEFFHKIFHSSVLKGGGKVGALLVGQ